MMDHIITFDDDYNIKTSKVVEMIRFCKSHYNHNEDWDWYSNVGEIVFRFKNEVDAVEFKLRYL